MPYTTVHPSHRMHGIVNVPGERCPHGGFAIHRQLGEARDAVEPDGKWVVSHERTGFQVAAFDDRARARTFARAARRLVDYFGDAGRSGDLRPLREHRLYPALRKLTEYANREWRGYRYSIERKVVDIIEEARA